MKLLRWLFVLIIVIAVGGYFLYKVYLPKLVANAVVNEQTPVYIPKQVQRKIDEYKAPLNKAATDVVQELHDQNIDIDQILKMIDETKEEQVYAALDELNMAGLKNTNQAFDIVKKHLEADFDLELLREPFNKNVNLKMIKRNLKQVSQVKEEQLVDAEVAREVIKRVLIEKEKELKGSSRQ